MNTTLADLKAEAARKEFRASIRTAIHNALETALYTPLKRHWRQQEEALIQKNSRLHGNTQACMRLRGTVFGAHHYGKQNPLPRRVNPAHPELREEISQFLAGRETVTRQELPYVLGYLRHCLTRTLHFEDLKELLPTALHAVLRRHENPILQYGADRLPAGELEQLLQQHQPHINMMKVRMTKNLLIHR